MADSDPSPMDLDLNLDPTPSSLPVESIDDRIRTLEEVTIRSRHLWRRLRNPPTRITTITAPTPTPSRLEPIEPIANVLQIGEASVAAEERRAADRVGNKEKRRGSDLIAKALRSEEENEGGGGDSSSSSTNSGSGFFDCNVCLDMASEPVLTTCGHLFCWPCLYQWLHVHSKAKECPVCKGEVTDTNITPIYGRGDERKKNKGGEEEAGRELKVPPRPQAKRIESMRQSLRRGAESGFSIQQFFQRIGSARQRILTIRDEAPIGDNANATNTVRSNQGLEENNVVSSAAQVAANANANAGTSNTSRRVLRSSSRRAANPQRVLDSWQRGEGSSQPSSNLLSVISSAETLALAQSFFLGQATQAPPAARNDAQSQPVVIDDRDSAPRGGWSTNMDLDSVVSISSSDGSRVSEVESGARRRRRRRRLN